MIIELKQSKKAKNMFEVLPDKKCLKELKTRNDIDSVFVSFKTLNLGQKLYGSSKQESIKIQRENSKKLIAIYKICKKAIKILSKRHQFAGSIFVDDLSKKRNNNDFMLAKMLEVSLISKPHKRLEDSIRAASDYLLLENDLNNMCDFQNSICAKHRAVEQKNESFSGCCPDRCKFNKKKICTEKCLACKIFMCNYIIERGYFFDVHSIPILKRNLTFFERAYLTGLLFTSLKSTTFFVRLVRLFEIVLVSFFTFVFVALLCVM